MKGGGARMEIRLFTFMRRALTLFHYQVSEVAEMLMVAGLELETFGWQVQFSNLLER